MKGLRNRLNIGLIAVLLFGMASMQRTNDEYFEITKNIDIFGKVLREVSLRYVDEVETNAFVRKGLDAMLGSLDPYTNFISSAEIEDFRFMSTGEYGGIGARIVSRDGKIIITEPYKDKPAYNSGLRAGDEIIQIDDEQVEGKEFSSLDIRNMLRGEANKSVVVKVRRYGEEEPLTMTVIRDKIKIDNVPYYGYVEDGIGYLSLSGFTRDASAEVENALKKLKEENPDIEGVIIDLRDNPGGLLFQAINIANLFVPQGETIVETKGRMEGSLKVYSAQQPAYDLEIPVAVLINGRSASASEIVSGVMQDLDRGVVVGRKSFGKGLVQTTRPLSYNNQIKITTARYYTPSGRCIQAIDYSNREEDGSVIRTPDSLSSEFRTRSGRPVRDAGGIDPDIEVKEEKLHNITTELVRQYLIFDFATKYYYDNQNNPPDPRQFEITDAIYEDFIAFVNEQGFEYESNIQKELDKFHELLKEEKYYDEIAAEVERLEQEIVSQRSRDIRLHRKEISKYLLEEIIARYHYQRGRIQAGFRNDEAVQSAIEVLQDPERYNEILAGPQGDAK